IGFGDPEDRVCVRVERDPKSPVLQAVAAALGATRAVHFVPVLGPARPWGAFAVAVTGDLGEDSAAEPLLLAARAMSGVLASGLGVSPPAPRAEVSRRSLEALLNLTLASESRARAGSGVAVYALPPTAIPGLSVGRVVRAFLDSTRPTEHVAPIGGDAVGMGFQIADSARRERVMARVRANLAKIGAPVERLAVVLAVPSAREAGALLADALAISRASA
ncbi:MAG TPA: hypothetical protein VKE69_08885, partial [Planctomycetota bacterium]|nr:hypothetical protein [Planctomycetota bacterium]